MDRLAPRQRPPGRPAMRQTWRELLFLHWAFGADVVQQLLPEGLDADTFDGKAWIGVVPFTMSGIRALPLPALPGCRAFHELNVRTYVHRDGCPGVWFFSLDAAHKLAVRVARRLFHLPYFDARMSLAREADTVRYESVRTHADAPWASLECRWTIGAPREEAEPGSLDFFLTERYCLYAAGGARIWRGRIHHAPWPLRDARVDRLKSSMLGQLGLDEPPEEPHVRYAEHLDVEIWGLER